MFRHDEPLLGGLGICLLVGPGSLRITAETDAVINITTGGASSMTMDERLAAAYRLRPELASMNMGSMNFVYSGIADKVTEWRHDWEKPYVLNTYSKPFVNTFDKIEHTADAR